MIDDLVDRVRLIRSAGVGPIAYRQLVGRFGTAGRALDALPDLARRGGAKGRPITTRAEAETEIDRVTAIGGRYIGIGTPDYPPLLAEMDSAPPLLTVIGDVALSRRPAVALVGARNASAAACRFARSLAHDLGSQGVTCISGLARGIDSAVHDGSLDSGTIAVIAGGLDIIYPPENAQRQAAIAERGLLVAEMPPGVQPTARHFPHRNRIIAGLAAATVVVEAAPRSGSLITARLAAEAGRDVLAVPGSPLDPRAQGCNQLIRDGATLIQNADDVMEALGGMGGGTRLREAVVPMIDLAVSEPAEPDGDARAAVEALLGPAAVPVDEIMRLSGLDNGTMQVILLELDLAGRLDRHAGGKVSLRAA